MRSTIIYAALTLALAHAAPANEAPVSAEKTSPARSMEKFMQSLSYADSAAVSEYCHAGGDVNICDPYTGMAALHFAARNNRRSAAAMLLDAAPKSTSRNKTGATPLHAASRGHADMAIMLLRHGADIDAYDRDGLTPLHLASQHNHPKMVETAGRLGRRHRSPHQRPRTYPLHWAAYIGCPNTVKALMRCGRQSWRDGQPGAHPVHWAKSFAAPRFAPHPGAPRRALARTLKLIRENALGKKIKNKMHRHFDRRRRLPGVECRHPPPWPKRRSTTLTCG